MWREQRNPEFTYVGRFPTGTSTFRHQLSEAREKFDYIIFNGIDDTVDVQRALRNLRDVCHRHTRLIVPSYNHLWEPLVNLAEVLGMKVPRSNRIGFRTMTSPSFLP